jgi:outer membrane protein assembly factor BamB/tetratricopeptide (TPR) repeat protein
MTLPDDARPRRKLDAARDYVKAQDWNEAVSVLQDLIEGKEDQFLPAGAPAAGGKSGSVSNSVRGEALRLLSALPPKGLETYKAVHGPRARALLKEAIDSDDLHVLVQVVQRYPHTDAGAEAAERLGSYHLDRGNRDLAGRCFVALLDRPSADRLPPATLYKAAIACRLANDKAHAEQAWKALAARAPDGLTIGGRLCELDRLRAGLDHLPALAPAGGDWRVYRGDAARNSAGDGDLPLLTASWSVPTPLARRRASLVDDVVTSLPTDRAGRPTLPGHYPVAVPGRIVYRGHDGLHAVDPVSGRESWKAELPLGLDDLAANSGKSVVVRSWFQSTYGDAYYLPVENAALGRLSTDCRHVYAIEELALPPPPELIFQVQGGLPASGPLALRQALLANRLWAGHLDTGERVWEIGGAGPGAFQKSFFLGAPLPVGNRLYALVDRDGEIRLVCLDPATGGLVWAQRLGSTSSSVAQDPGRRLRGVQMACAGGLLICPTDAGAVFAFDLFAGRLAWVYVYPSRLQAPGLLFNLSAFRDSWRESAPAVAGDKVIFTPADSDAVHCVNLQNGQPVWQQSRRGTSDLYLAGAFGDRALLVGNGSTRALALTDGHEAWQRDFGRPSGQGTAAGETYYLPLSISKQTGGPGVLAFDVGTGRSLGFAPSRSADVPGNLTFFGGEVLSQTATALTAYPQLRSRLKLVEKRVAADPHNPRGLAERGTLRLDGGDVEGGLADLRAALAATPSGAARREADQRLHDGLHLALQRDFARGEKYLAEFEGSCRGAATDAEQQRREANYLLILARGLEEQGRAAEALSAYARLYGKAERAFGNWVGPEGGWLAEPPSSARPGAARPEPDRWIHARVTGMVTAGGSAKEAVEKEVTRQWRQIAGRASLEDLGRFVSLFGSVAPSGLEARLAYAERLGWEARGRFLETELHLLALQRQREAPQVAARALEMLARLLTEKGQTDDALYYYRQLAREFGTTSVREGKKGADFFDELALDRRFLGLLDDLWAGRKYRMSDVRGLFPLPAQTIWMEPEGEAPPCLRRQRLAFDASRGALKLIDRNTGAELWSQTVDVGGLRQLLRAAPPQAWIPYRAEGHLAVVSLGNVACGIDLLNRRQLWVKDVGDRSIAFVPPLITDARASLSVQYPDGTIQPLGQMSPLRSAGVCLQVRGQLVALDPIRGVPLWVAVLSDPLTEVLADDTHGYLVESLPGNSSRVRRAFVLRSGEAQPVPVLPIPPAQLLQSFDRNLLVFGGPRGCPNRLALHDALTGRDAWSRDLRSGELLAHSAVPHLTATMASDGKVQVYDLRRRAKLFGCAIDPDHLRGVNDVVLCRDDSHYYLMLNRPPRAHDRLVGPALPNAVGGLPTRPANGYLYAFYPDGSLHWANEIKAQHLILEQMEQSPLLLFSAVVQRADPRSPAPVFTVTSIDKHTGKTVWLTKDYTPITSPIHRVQIDAAGGTVELIGRHWRFRHTTAD